MLEKKIDYYSRVPLEAYVSNVTEYPVHCHHDDLEIVVVLKGMIKIIVGYRTLLLKEGEVFIFNEDELHGLYTAGEDNKILTFHANAAYFRKYNQSGYGFFFLMAATYLNNERYDMPVEQLKEQLFRIAKIGFMHNGSDELMENLGKELFRFLLDNFQYIFFTASGGKHFINRHEGRDNQAQAGRVRELMCYIWDNYDQKITLQEYADETHINMYYLSHIFKDSTGLNFQEMLNFARVEKSEWLLLETNKKISEIASDCGFSATRYYVKHFEKWFQTDPNVYRQKNMRRVVSKISEEIYKDTDAIETIDLFLGHKTFNAVEKSFYYTDVIEIDAQHTEKKRRAVYPQILEWNDGFSDEFYRNFEDIGLLKKSFRACMPVKSCNDINNRLFSFIEENRNNSLLVRCESRENLFKTLEHLAFLCNNVDRDSLNLYVEFDSTMSSKIKADIMKQISERVKGSSCRLCVKEFTKHKTNIYKNNYIMDSMYIMSMIIKNALAPGNEQKFINSITDTGGSGERVIKGSSGLITGNFIKKPSYYAYSCLAQLGDEVIDNSDGYIVTRRKRDIQILFYDYDDMIFDNLEDYIDPDKLNAIQHTSDKNKEFKIELSNLRGEYAVSQVMLGKGICLFSKLYDMGMPETIMEEDEVLMKKFITPTVSFFTLDGTKKFPSIDVKVPNYGVTLLRLKRLVK